MLKKIFSANSDYALTISRLVLGTLFFIHGDQLMLGRSGGYGLSGSMHFFTHQLGIPATIAFLAICDEFFGGLLLISGLMRRVGALAIICTMAVAAREHWQFGLFMNWFGTQTGEGFEYHLLAITLGLVIVLRGSGALSLDRLLTRSRASIPAQLPGVASGAPIVASRP
jgi:putative oxidoreductase